MPGPSHDCNVVSRQSSSRLTLITVITPVTAHHPPSAHRRTEQSVSTEDQIKPNNSAGAPDFSPANLTGSQELSDPGPDSLEEFPLLQLGPSHRRSFITK